MTLAVLRTISPAPRVELTFEWHGGMYIDVSLTGSSTAVEVINVGHATDRPPFTRESLDQIVDAWIENYGEDGGDLLHDVTANWIYY